jgi:hypothetical protein
MNATLSFKQHIQNIVSKSLQIYGWMVRTLVTRDRQVILKIYKTIIRPNLEYASSVWNPTAVGQIQSIEKVQRKVTKLILGKNIPYEERLRILQLPSLRWRRHYFDLLRVYMIVNADNEPEIRKTLFTFNSEISNTSLRRHRLALYKEEVHSNLLKNQFANRVIDSWNSLPSLLVTLPTLQMFKSNLKRHLMNTSRPYT